MTWPSARPSIVIGLYEGIHPNLKWSLQPIKPFILVDPHLWMWGTP